MLRAEVESLRGRFIPDIQKLRAQVGTQQTQIKDAEDLAVKYREEADFPRLLCRRGRPDEHDAAYV